MGIQKKTEQKNDKCRNGKIKKQKKTLKNKKTE